MLYATAFIVGFILLCVGAERENYPSGGSSLMTLGQVILGCTIFVGTLHVIGLALRGII